MNEFSQTNDNVIMNFSLKYCQTEAELLQSMGFQKVLKTISAVLKKMKEYYICILRIFAEMRY